MTPFSLNIKGKLLSFSKPLIMGIVNATPDSFYPHSRTLTKTDVAERVKKMVDQGVDIIDVGACSTRPNTTPCEYEEELRRLRKILETVIKHKGTALVSIDTFRADIARVAVNDYGADIINDVSGGEIDEQMFTTVASLKVPYILTHPGNHFTDVKSEKENQNGIDITASVAKYLSIKCAELSLLGVADIIVDPGIGFGKSTEDNFRLISQLDVIAGLVNMPVLIGLSRKSLITKTLNCTSDDALCATSALNALALERGTSILRVHDVAAASQVIEIWNHLSITK